MVQMAFCDLSHTFHKKVTNVSHHFFVILLWGTMTPSHFHPANSSELYENCLKVMFLHLFSRGIDQSYEKRCLFVAVGLYGPFTVLLHWDIISQAHMVTLSHHSTRLTSCVSWSSLPSVYRASSNHYYSLKSLVCLGRGLNP